MSQAEYVQQLIELGEKIHCYKNVWWLEVKPFYYWPIDLFQPLSAPYAKANPCQALVGYEYLTNTPSQANSRLLMMSLEDPSSYQLEKLCPKKRNQIKRGLEAIDVKPITDQKQFIKQGYQINLSALKRQGRKPAIAKLYTSPTQWQHRISKLFPLKDREIWGAYFKKQLVAYIRTLKIEKTIFITNAMSHSDYLSYYPNDALIYTYLKHQKENNRQLKRIVFGLFCNKPTLNKFKQQLGFQKTAYPLFRWVNPLIKPLIRFTKYRHYFYVNDQKSEPSF